MTRLGPIARDVRVLGGSAPLRAIYEASKRSGLHSLMFRERRIRSACASVPIGLGGTIPLSDVARRRCLEDAELILTEGVRVFGKRAATGVHAPWNIDPVTGSGWPAREKWWRIDIRSDDRLSDVKWVWEAGRHRDVVVLARASALDPAGAWLAELEAMLRAWVAQCSPERGVHWYSSLELALRSIAWAQMLELVGDRLDQGLRRQLEVQLLASARHIMLELPYTVSSMKNNHLLGDGLGLVVIGRLFPGHAASQRWRRLGDAIFLKQLDRHMRADGSMIEDSLSYHRFVLEMLIVRVLIGGADPAVRRALADASMHLRGLGALDGDVPQYGDWDEGRVLADSAPAGSVAGSALAGLALTGRSVDAQAWVDHDELAWYVASDQADKPLEPLDPVRVSGDFQIVEKGPWRVWFKVTSGPSHQHADVSSVWIQREGRWLIREQGTGTYNGPIEVRNAFRTSIAHPVWHPEGVDQLIPHRAFRWLRSVRGYAAAPHRHEDAVVLFGWHDAFELEDTSCRVARAVVVRDVSVTVIDFIEEPGQQAWVLTVPTGGSQTTDFFGLEEAELVSGSASPFLGWFSETYGTWEPSPWLVRNTFSQLEIWGVGQAPRIVRGSPATVDDVQVSVIWEPNAATFCLDGARSLRLEVRRG